MLFAYFFDYFFAFFGVDLADVFFAEAFLAGAFFDLDFFGFSGVSPGGSAKSASRVTFFFRNFGHFCDKFYNFIFI